MLHTPLFWKLYLTYLLAVALCAGVVGWLAVGTASDLYHQQAYRDLRARAELASSQIAPLLDHPGQLQTLVKTFGTNADTRLTVIAGPTDERLGRARSRLGPVKRLAMLRCDAGSPATFQNGMDGDDVALIENADNIW